MNAKSEPTVFVIDDDPAVRDSLERLEMMMLLSGVALPEKAMRFRPRYRRPRSRSPHCSGREPTRKIRLRKWLGRNRRSIRPVRRSQANRTRWS
jgi:hypothetical protein